MHENMLAVASEIARQRIITNFQFWGHNPWQIIIHFINNTYVSSLMDIHSRAVNLTK